MKRVPDGNSCSTLSSLCRVSLLKMIRARFDVKDVVFFFFSIAQLDNRVRGSKVPKFRARN